MQPRAPKQGQTFAHNGYVPAQGHVVHLNWDPAVGHEMKGPHYGLVVSATDFHHGTGLCFVCPITSKVGKLSAFEMPITAGRVNGAVILSALRSIDFQTRDLQFETTGDPTLTAEATRRLRMVIP